MASFSIPNIFSAISGGSDTDIGSRVLQSYFAAAKMFSNFAFGTFEEFAKYLNSKAGYDFVSHVGEVIRDNYASTDESDAMARLNDLASKSQGAATVVQIMQAAGGSGTSVNWSAGLPEIAANAGAEFVSVAENVGAGLLSTANAVKYLPYILGAAAVLFIVVKAKGPGGRQAAKGREVSSSTGGLKGLLS